MDFAAKMTAANEKAALSSVIKEKNRFRQAPVPMV